MTGNLLTAAADSLRADGYQDLDRLENPDLEAFWAQAEMVYHQTTEYRESESRRKMTRFDHGPVDFFRQLYHALRVSSSGKGLPTKNLGEKRRERSQVANQIRKLRTQARADQHLAQLQLADLFEMLTEGTTARAAAEEIRAACRKTYSWTALHGVTLIDILTALETELDAFNPLCFGDDTEWPTGMPKANTQNRARIWMERRLAGIFMQYTGSPQTGLIAKAINAQFNDLEAVTADAICDRLRNR